MYIQLCIHHIDEASCLMNFKNTTLFFFSNWTDFVFQAACYSRKSEISFSQFKDFPFSMRWYPSLLLLNIQTGQKEALVVYNCQAPSPPEIVSVSG